MNVTFTRDEVINRLQAISEADDENAGDLILDLYVEFVNSLATDTYQGSPNELARMIVKGMSNECLVDSHL